MEESRETVSAGVKLTPEEFCAWCRLGRHTHCTGKRKMPFESPHFASGICECPHLNPETHPHLRVEVA